MPYLAVTAGLPPKIFELKPGTCTVGRSSGADFSLKHVEISRQHCRFTWDGKHCSVEDLGSVRGTQVNGEKLAGPFTLQAGDKVGIGPAIVEFGIGVPPKIEGQESVAPGAHGAQMLVRGQPADRIEVVGEITIGRDSGIDVWLNDPGVSRRHATVSKQPGGGVVVTDLNSTAGSFVNGHRFDAHALTIGDRLQVGPFCFQFDGHALNRVANAAGGTIRAGNVFFRSGMLMILDDINLAIPASRFVGIIGPSGAGKSSLLNTLSGLRAPERGAVFVDGEDIYSGYDPRSFGFVPQEDIVHPELTVSEALRFSARLRLPAHTPPLEIQKLVLQTLDQLGLRPHAAKSISNLSGGQRKRVSVGVELLARPSILFLDEPSSGLDPATEFQLMELLRNLADTGCTIVCTTHVMENAYLMDQLIVLVGGCLAFQGSAQSAREYFKVPKLTGLYDRLGEQPPKQWQTAFVERNLAGALDVAAAASAVVLSDKARRAFALPILLQRQWAILRSDWRNFALLIGQPIIIALLVAWVTTGEAPEPEADEPARIDLSMAMFFAYLATLWFGCSNAAQEIVKEIPIYRRERLVGVGAHSYLASKFLFLIATTAVQALLLYLTLLAARGGLDGSVLLQIAALLGTSLAAVGIGLAISALARSVMQAVMFVPLILIPQILFSGFTVKVSEMSQSVLAVSRFTPTFSSQTVMDVSFLWQQKMGGGVMRDHRSSYTSLVPDRDLSNDDVFDRPRPAILALLGHALWGVLTYWVAWFALKKRERV